MKNNLKQYHYLILQESNYNEDNLIETIERHIVTGETKAIELIYDFGINKVTLKNLRTLAKNLLAKYYLCHNNKLNNN